jgi:hypothetical protein
MDSFPLGQFSGPVTADELIREALHPYPDKLALTNLGLAG